MNNKRLKIIKKYYEYGLTKLKVLKYQNHFKWNGIDVKHMYKSCAKSDLLVVIFSACTRVGLPARYNYVKTLEKVKCNQLFILDDFGPDGRGSYYLGRMPDFKEQEAVIELVQKIVAEKKPKTLLFCGSCKGGYGALNIGSCFKDSVMIIGEPTYRIATEYGLAPKLQSYWMGEITSEHIKKIDYYLSERLKANENKGTQKIYFFYSGEDEYLERHTKPLLSDLRNYNYDVVEEKADFKEHADLALWFPTFLKKHVEEYLK